MYVFPKISLRPEVENYLKESFLNEEAVSASSRQEAERKFETLLLRLSHPPSMTTVRVSRKDIFNGLPDLKGIGIRMTEPIYLSPSFDNVLPSYIFLQNLPSTVVAHVLDPQPGEKILDMCAAPGGKTTHTAALMQDKGEVIALDKILTKVNKLKQNASLLGLHSIRAFCFDATKTV